MIRWKKVKATKKRKQAEQANKKGADQATCGDWIGGRRRRTEVRKRVQGEKSKTKGDVRLFLTH